MTIQGKMRALTFLSALVLVSVLAIAACGGGNSASNATRTPAHSPTASAGARSPAATSPAAGSARSSASPAATSVTIKMLSGQKFDKTELKIPANQEVRVTADNEDSGTQHNFAVYKSKSDADAGKAALASTSVCKGPCKEDVTLKLAPGDYYFQCQIHPQKMNGRLVVE